MNSPKKNEGPECFVGGAEIDIGEKSNLFPQFYNVMWSFNKAHDGAGASPCHSGYFGIGIPIGDAPDSS